MIRFILILATSFLIVACTKNPSTADVEETVAHESASYQTVTDDNFDTFAASSKVTVVDFWATWCGPCLTMAPRFESAANELDSLASFGKIDVDQNAALASRFKIHSIPTILILKNGDVVDKIIGVVSKEQLVNQVKIQL